MTRNPPHIQACAERHMRAAHVRGATDKASICEYAQAALEAEGFDETNAATTIEVLWSRHFGTIPPQRLVWTLQRR